MTNSSEKDPDLPNNNRNQLFTERFKKYILPVIFFILGMTLFELIDRKYEVETEKIFWHGIFVISCVTTLTAKYLKFEKIYNPGIVFFLLVQLAVLFFPSLHALIAD